MRFSVVNRFWLSAAILCLLLLAASCTGNRFYSYRLTPSRSGLALQPPQVKDPNLVRRMVSSRVPRADGQCISDPDGAVQFLKRGGKALSFTVARDRLLEHPAGWLSEWAAQMEIDGCVPPGRAHDFAESITNAIALPPAAAARLTNEKIHNGYTELTPGSGLEIRSPIFRDAKSVAKSPEIGRITGLGPKLTVDLKTALDAVGTETVLYNVRNREYGPGFRLVLLSVQRIVQGISETPSTPKGFRLELPASALFFAINRKTDQNGVVSMIVFAANIPQLYREARFVGSDPSNCEARPATCLVLPKNTGINFTLLVKVNGKTVCVPWNSDVRGALRASGLSNFELVLPTLRLNKPYGGAVRPLIFNRTSAEILDFPLTGGEEISW